MPRLGSRFLALVLCGASPSFAAAQTPVTITSREPVAPAPVAEGSPSAFDRLDVPAAIRSIYDRFSEISRLSGQDIRFAISEVKSYRRAQFAGLLVVDLMSKPAGRILETQVLERAGRLPSEDLVAYRSEWKIIEARHSEAPDASLANLTLAELFERERVARPVEVGGIVALSLYQVTLTFDGRIETYRTSLSWRAVGPDRLLFRLNDPVAHAAEGSFEEDRRIGTPSQVMEDQPAEDLLQPLGCVVESSSVSDTLRIDGQEGHSSGTHFGILNSTIECSSSSDCNSRCTIATRPWSCGDSGGTGLLSWHQATSKFGRSSVLGAGLGVGAHCGSAIGCAIQQCSVLGGCGVTPTITFGGTGAGIEATINGAGVIADLSLESGAECPPTRLFQLPPPPRCEEQVSSVVALGLEPAAGPKLVPTSKAISLRQLEPSAVVHHNQPVQYLMAEWSLVTTAKDGFGVRQRSSNLFPDASAKELALAALGRDLDLAMEPKVLLVAVPAHEANSRMIAIPELRLPRGLPQPTRERGRVLIRADFAEDHRLQGLSVLHSENAAGSRELLLHLERVMTLEPSTERHRVVTFAWLRAGETVEVESYLSYLPRCCCGFEFCA